MRLTLDEIQFWDTVFHEHYSTKTMLEAETAAKIADVAITARRKRWDRATKPVLGARL